MRLETVLNFVIDANLALLVAALVVLVFEAVLLAAGYRRAYGTRLKVVMTSLLALLVLPLLVPVTETVVGPNTPQVSDLLVAQYLKGNISMSAVGMNDLLSMRQIVVDGVVSGNSGWLLAAAAFVVTAMIARAAYVGVNLIRICRLIRGGVVIRRIGRVRVVVSSRAKVPFSTRGPRNHYVVLPQSLLLDSKAVEISIGHEFQHIRQRDIEVEVLTAFASPLFVLNPGFWIMSMKLRKLREYTCDLEYLKRSGCDPKQYARALLRVAREAFSRHAVPSPQTFSVPFIGRSKLFPKSVKTGLAERITVLANGERKRPPMLISAALIVGIVSSVALGTIAFQNRAGWSHDRLMLSSVANLERLNERNRRAAAAAQ